MHPFYEEAIEEMFSRVDDWRQEGTRQRRAEARKRTTNVVQLVLSWIISLIEDKCLRQEFGLLHRPMTHGEYEIEILRAARTLAFSSRATDHYAYIKRITDHLEDQIRRFFLVTGSLIFGDQYFEHCPTAVKNYAYKNLGDRPSYAVEINLFDGLTRPQLRSIFMDGNDLKDQIVKPMQLTWKREDWETFVDTFSKVNILVAHQQTQAFSAEERQRYLRYCVLAEELMAEMNKAISRLIETSMYLKPGDATTDNMPCLFRCALRRPEGLQVTSANWNVLAEWPKALLKSKEHELPKKVFETVRNTVLGSIDRAPDGIVVQDLLDVEYIASHYRATVREVILSLAYCHYCSHELEVAPWFGSCVIVRKSRRPVPS